MLNDSARQNAFLSGVPVAQRQIFSSYHGLHGRLQLAAPINFIRDISAGKLDYFPLDFVSVTDERGSVINDYL